MLLKPFLTVGLLTIASLTLPPVAHASESRPASAITAQAETTPTSQQILNACAQNQAETLPNPFTDVPRQHWAFKAVVTLHYCGANRQAALSRMTEQPTEQQSPNKTQ
ncbi:MAG: hypothetical protein ACAF41_19100 [Leptolyngbya sp. BL-A-14]